MKTLAISTHALLVFVWLGLAAPHGLTAVEPQTSQKPAASAAKPATTVDDARPPARAHRTLSGSTARADASLCLQSRQGGGARRMARQPDAERNRASRCGDEGGLRAELRGSGPLSSSRGGDGGRSGLDDQARPGVHRRSLGGLRQYPAAESQGAAGREAQDHAAAGGRDPNHVEWPAGGGDRAGQPASRLRAAVQPADRLHHDVIVHGGRSAGKQQ